MTSKKIAVRVAEPDDPRNVLGLPDEVTISLATIAGIAHEGLMAVSAAAGPGSQGDSVWIVRTSASARTRLALRVDSCAASLVLAPGETQRRPRAAESVLANPSFQTYPAPRSDSWQGAGPRKSIQHFIQHSQRHCTEIDGLYGPKLEIGAVQRIA